MATKKNSAETKSAAKPAAGQKPAKAGKLDKGAKAESAKPAKAAGQGQGQASKYKGLKITLTEAGKSATPRGGRAVRFDMVKKAKTTDDVLGKPYRLEGEAEDRTFNVSNLHPFVDAGYITLG